MAEGSGAPRGRGASGSERAAETRRRRNQREDRAPGRRAQVEPGLVLAGATSGTTNYGRGKPSSDGAGQDARGGRGGAPRTSSGARTSSGDGPRRGPRAAPADGGVRSAPRPASGRTGSADQARRGSAPRASRSGESRDSARTFADDDSRGSRSPASGGPRKPPRTSAGGPSRGMTRTSSGGSRGPQGDGGRDRDGGRVAGRLLVAAVPLRGVTEPAERSARRTIEGQRGAPSGRYRHRLRRTQAAIRGRRFLRHPPKVRCRPSGH